MRTAKLTSRLVTPQYQLVPLPTHHRTGEKTKDFTTLDRRSRLRFLDPKSAARSPEGQKIQGTLRIGHLKEDGVYWGKVAVSYSGVPKHFVKWLVEIKDGKVIRQSTLIDQARTRDKAFLRLTSYSAVHEGELVAPTRFQKHFQVAFGDKRSALEARRIERERQMAIWREEQRVQREREERLAEEKRIEDLNRIPISAQAFDFRTPSYRRRLPSFSHESSGQIAP